MSAPRSRHSIRLKGYDYAQAGAYFVTVCTQDRACLFGEIVDSAMRPNDSAKMVQTQWHALPTRFPGIELDAFVVMPNHIHGIIVMVGAGLVPAQNVGADPGMLGDHKGRPYGHVSADHDGRADGGEPGPGLIPARHVGAGLVPARNVGAHPGMSGDHKGRPYGHMPGGHDGCADRHVPTDHDGCADGGEPGPGLVPARHVGAGLVPARNVGADPGMLGDHKGRPYGHVSADHDGRANGGEPGPGLVPARHVGAGLVPARNVGAHPDMLGDHKGRPYGRMPGGHDGRADGGEPGPGLVPARNVGMPGTGFASAIGDIVGAFKSITTVLYARGTKQSAWQPFRGRVWQRNYYEHIIRDEASLNRVRQYIADNPIHWAEDRENPAVVTPRNESS